MIHILISIDWGMRGLRHGEGGCGMGSGTIWAMVCGE